jgi:hypothetical protein
MYMYWFQDDSVLSGTTITGNTFYVTARFFNAKDGSILNFSNKTLSPTTNIIESSDMYYKMVIDTSDYSYQFFRYNGTTGSRIGRTGDPINFYEAVGGTS